MITATEIKTVIWKQIIQSLIENNWVVIYKYDNIDAGIDFDLLLLEKNSDKILFGWDNWLEGEIQCSKETMAYIENIIGLNFKKGSPMNLKPEIISLYIK